MISETHSTAGPGFDADTLVGQLHHQEVLNQQPDGPVTGHGNAGHGNAGHGNAGHVNAGHNAGHGNGGPGHTGAGAGNANGGPASNYGFTVTHHTSGSGGTTQ